MVADYVVTEHDCRRRVVANDPVGMGNYNMDSHNTGRYVTAEGTVKNEGNVRFSVDRTSLVIAPSCRGRVKQRTYSCRFACPLRILRLVRYAWNQCL